MASYDWGGAATGAMGGASIGNMLMPGIGTALGAGVGALGGLFGGKKGTGPSYMLFDPDKKYRESMMPMWQQNLDYDQDQLARLQRGEAPSWFTNAMPKLRDYQMQQLNNQYFGNQGQRGSSMYGRAMEEGALAGIGGRASLARAGQVSNDYANQAAGIDDMITRAQLGIMENMHNQYGAGAVGTRYKNATATPQM